MLLASKSTDTIQISIFEKQKHTEKKKKSIMKLKKYESDSKM